MNEKYVVLDIETTGLSKQKHKITEIAAIKVRNFKIEKKFHTLINPETRIPSFITSLTGITNSMVKDSPIIEEVMPKFVKFLDQSPIVAHCATFDCGFLNHNSETILSKELENPKICTRKLSRRLIPCLGSYKLSSLCQHFRIENNQAHRAMGDAKATHEIFNRLFVIMKKQGIERRQHVLDFQDSKIPRLV